MTGIRLTLAFLLAPAIVALWLLISIEAVLMHLGWEASDTANIFLGMSWFMDGVVIPYRGALRRDHVRKRPAELLDRDGAGHGAIAGPCRSRVLVPVPV